MFIKLSFTLKLDHQDLETASSNEKSNLNVHALITSVHTWKDIWSTYVCSFLNKLKLIATKKTITVFVIPLFCSIAVVDEKLNERKHVFIVEDNTQDFMYKTNN